MADQHIPYAGPIVTRDEAKERGEKRYFTEKPCKNGHISQRHTNTGKCIACFEIRQKRWESKNIDKIRESERIRYAKNVEKYRGAQKKYREKNIEYFTTRRIKYYSENKEALQQYSRSYYHTHKDLIAKKRMYENISPEKRAILNAKSCEWKSKNPLKNAINQQRRRAREKSSYGTFTAEEVIEIFSMQRKKCAICRNKIKGSFSIDHIIPLSKGGNNTRRNIQVVHKKCNSRKHAKDPLDFARELGKLL